jgi:hypothetical protein
MWSFCYNAVMCWCAALLLRFASLRFWGSESEPFVDVIGNSGNGQQLGPGR